MAEESDPCGYVRRIFPLPGREEIQMILKCSRTAHPDHEESQSSSGRGGNHRATLIEGVVVYFETEKPDEAAAK